MHAHIVFCFDRNTCERGHRVRRIVGAIFAMRTAARAAAVKGRRRCRMHGGAPGSGAPRGVRNGNYRHGLRTMEAMAEQRLIRALTRASRKLIDSLGTRGPTSSGSDD